jgi:murein L,D-transpeptidase YcbB/YkuD
MKVIRKSHRGVSFGLAAAIGLAACAAAAERVNLIAAPPPVFPDLSTALTIAFPESRGIAAKPNFALSPAADLFAAPTSPAIAAMTPPSDAAVQPPSALEVALAAMIAEGVKSSPIGAGDWRAARQAIHDVYAGRAFAPIWMAPDGRLTPAGVAALSRLERADEDGLDLSAFALPKGPLADPSPERVAEAEAAMSEAIVAYAMQASGARLVPTRISPLITQRPTVADPGHALAAVAAAADPDAALEDFNPRQKGYLDLRTQLRRLRPDAPVAGAPRIPTGPSLGIGMIDPRVALVRARLGVSAPADAKDALVYDLRLATAVATFQRATGLSGAGVLTPATVAALSHGTSDRRDAMILANMEMWRWEPRAMGDERIEINIPDYSLKLMSGETLVHQARVIVGKPDTPTPVFSNEMRYILVNPIWRVPDSIIKKEMAPKLAQDPDYLTRRGFEVSQVGDRLVVRQPPGEANALGRILFMFPNEHAVYLHDTPARALFSAARRAFSHGCVRVEEPMRLAELLMGGASAGWTPTRLEGLIGDKERTVPLPHTIPIHLEYFTEFVDGSGALQDREDIYGIARRVAITIAPTSQD